MIRKKYILALTFLCLLCGQVSYGQSQWCSDCNSTGANILHFVGTPFRFVGGLISSFGNPGYNNDYTSGYGNNYGDSSSFGGSESSDWGSEGTDDGWIEWTPYSDEYWYFNEEDYSWMDYDGGEISSSYDYTEEDLNKYLSTYCAIYPADCVNDKISWYIDKDGDGYHSETKKSTISPGIGWVQGTSNGLDCDDNEPTKTINCNINYYLDVDHDGYESGTQRSITSPGIGWEEGASMGIDCNDNDPVIKECIAPTPVEIINTAICRCIDPPNKPKFNNVTNVWNVLDGKKWVEYAINCNDSAKNQIAQASLPNSTPQGAGSEINFFIDKKRQTQSGKLTAEIDLQKGIDVIAKNLKEGKPVLAGVMYERYHGADRAPGGTLGDNNNVATNHYVVIVGMGIDNGKPYFSYYDNFVDSQFKDGSPRSESTRELIGTNIYENRFYLYPDSVGNYYFSDKTAKTIDGPTSDPNHNGHGFGNQYILSEIRDNY